MQHYRTVVLVNSIASTTERRRCYPFVTMNALSLRGVAEAAEVKISRGNDSFRVRQKSPTIVVFTEGCGKRRIGEGTDPESRLDGCISINICPI